MSYRLITKGHLNMKDANGAQVADRTVEVRAYGAPKRDNAGTLKLDGQDVTFKRTGGKGRGTAVKNYIYFTAKNESAYVEITQQEADKLAGATIEIKLEQAAEAPKVEEPQAEAKTEQPTKAARRVKKEAQPA